MYIWHYLSLCVKVQKVYLALQSQSLGQSHPVPAQAPPTLLHVYYKHVKGRATNSEVPGLET